MYEQFFEDSMFGLLRCAAHCCAVECNPVLVNAVQPSAAALLLPAFVSCCHINDTTWCQGCSQSKFRSPPAPLTHCHCTVLLVCISQTLHWRAVQVRQVSHWVTTTTPYFFEPMRTAATFKMLPDPAFVVIPPSCFHCCHTLSSCV